MAFSTSGNLLADRRFEWARGAASERDLAGAADLLGQVLDLVPEWAVAWAALGEANEGLGRRAEALCAWQRAASLDGGGELGAELHCARLSGTAPLALPAAYVKALFDDYAPRFERHLTRALAYRAPTLIVAALDAAAPGRRFGQVLDLGCGTGLMAGALAQRASAVDGVDLSPAMIARARGTGLYRTLEVGSLVDVLQRRTIARYDLVCAADVLVYLGDLGPVFTAVADSLVPGGLFGFTVQSGDGGEDATPEVTLGPDLRFVHARAHIERVAGACALFIVSLEPASTRTEKGADVPGLVGLARSASPRAAS